MTSTADVKDGTGESEHDALRKRIGAALNASIDHCARCKVCDNQTNAVMEVIVSVLARVVAQAVPEPAPEPGAPPLPEGIFGRVELPGRRDHTGWVTEETRFGAQHAVVRDWDGSVIAEVVPGPGCQLVHLPTPLKRPEPPRALGVAVEDWDSPEDSAYDDDDSDGGPF